MKVKIQNYIFSVSQKKVTFIDYPSIRLDSILLVTNVTRHTIIYNFADDSALGSVLTNVLTLTADLTGMLDTDKLQIFYETDDIAATDSSSQSMLSALYWIKRIAKILEPISVQDSNNRQRVVVESAASVAITAFSPTISNVTTVGTVSNLGLIANIDPRYSMTDQARVAYNTGPRANIKVS